MADIELRLYRYFVALCEEQNFSRASERLNITPPTLTHQIQKLERELNVRLLNRKTKMKLQLTEAGLRFFDSARDVLHRAEEAVITVRRAARGEIGRLEIGYIAPTIHSGLVQRVIRPFQDAHPSIDIGLRQTSTVNLLKAIISNELDAGFARLPKQYPSGVSGFLIHRAPVVLAIPSSNPLAHEPGPINPKMLANETFVATTVNYDIIFTRNIDSVAKLSEFTPKISKRAEDLTTVLAYVAAGYGIAAISQDMGTCQLPNVTFRTIDAGTVPEVVYVFLYRSNETAPAARALITAMRAHALKDMPKSTSKQTGFSDKSPVKL